MVDGELVWIAPVILKVMVILNFVATPSDMIIT
jgi:hypothetical protein